MNDLYIYFLTSFLISLLWILISKRNFNSVLLCIYHILLGGIFLHYSLNNLSDAQEYFANGSLYSCKFTDSLNRFDISNPYIIFCLSGIFKKFFNNYGFVSGIYSFLGFLGLNYFYQISINFISKKKYYLILLNILFFLPSLSFWTSGVSKDSLLILAYALIFKIFYLKNNLLNIKVIFEFALGILMTLLIRPYLFLFIVISFLFSRLSNLINIFKNKNIDIKTFLLIIGSLLLLLPAINIFGSVIQIGGGFEFDFNKLNYDLLKQRMSLNNFRALQSGGTYITQNGISKLILILFGPFSTKSITYLMESLTGIVFGVLCFSMIFDIFIAKFIVFRSYLLFTIMLCGLELLKFQFAVFNLGIIVRQRIYIIVLISVLLSYLINLKNKKREII